MPVREIIEINDDLCVGCGNCVPNCSQGALQVIDGKVRLLSDLMCEGIGACVGHCPTGAMSIERREAPAYDERTVMAKICAGGPNVIAAHLAHLQQHGQTAYLAEAHAYLQEHGLATQTVAPSVAAQLPKPAANHGGGCPGAAARSIPAAAATTVTAATAASTGNPAPSALRHWPVQLHLLNPAAGHLKGADLLLSADCSAFAMGSFHQQLLQGKALAIACPKLDSALESYVEKLRLMIDQAQINTLTVVIMEVPCCGGLVQIARAAAAQAERVVPVKRVVLSIEGQILEESWLRV